MAQFGSCLKMGHSCDGSKVPKHTEADIEERRRRKEEEEEDVHERQMAEGLIWLSALCKAATRSL